MAGFAQLEVTLRSFELEAWSPEPARGVGEMSERNDGPRPREMLQLAEGGVLHRSLRPRHRRSLTSDLKSDKKTIVRQNDPEIVSHLILFLGQERLVTVSGGWSMVLGGHLREEHLNQV